MAHLTNASASSSSTAAPPNTDYSCNFDVFLNHRGEDCKKTFASHLYRRLRLHGFRVFLDKPEMQPGDSLTSQIRGAIATASVHIAIFSPRYAESKWCLEELVLMLESKATIIPVFYHVHPSVLRWTGDESKDYGQALRYLKKKKRHEPKAIESWRKALSDVAEISGLELEAYNGDEGELVDKVVEQVEKNVRKIPLDVVTYPTGLDENLKEFENALVLQQERHSGPGKIVGIVGPGGVGKTTLAGEFFNRKSSDYDRSCFLADVRDAASRGSLHILQNKLIKNLASSPLGPDLVSTAEGRGQLSTYLQCYKALIILDDVEDIDQLSAFYSPLKDVLCSGSLILVTSRNKETLTRSGMEGSSIYEVKALNSEHSQELFCLHAFHKRLPSVGFEQLSANILNVCGGLPLSLKVIGGLLYEKNLKYWESQLRKICRIPPTDIQSRLIMGYENLDREEKDLFLDIACFFIKEHKDVAIRVWDACGSDGWLNLQNLENRYLVKIDSQNCITMHDHLRDMGRELAEQDPPRRHVRLWRPTDNLPNVSYQSIVRGLNMVQGKSGQSIDNRVEQRNYFIDMTRLQLLRAEGDCLESISNLLSQSDLLWLCWNNYPYKYLPTWIPRRNLRILQVAGGELETLWRHENEAPRELRVLNVGAALLRFPESIGLLEHLEKIEVKEVIEPLPEEFFHLHSLKHLCLQTTMPWLPDSLGNLINLRHIDMSGSRDLQTLPSSFGKLTELQHISLNECKRLQMLPHSFGNLVRLKHLSLAGCSILTISSRTFGNISTLESLDLSGCRKVEILPLQVTHQRSLQELNLLKTNLKELPGTIGNLIDLKVLKLQSPSLEMLPQSLGQLTSLKELLLNSCNNLKSLPDSIGELKQLKTLMIHSARIECLPASVTELNNLEILKVIYGPLNEVPFSSLAKVKGKEALADPRGRGMVGSSIDKCMLRLKQLDLHGTRIKELSFPQGVCPDLEHLNSSYCVELVKVGSLPTKLISLHLQDCSALEEINDISSLVKLRLLDIRGCNQIKELSGVEMLTSLEVRQRNEVLWR